jgi:hypothetical protein
VFAPVHIKGVWRGGEGEGIVFGIFGQNEESKMGGGAVGRVVACIWPWGGKRIALVTCSRRWEVGEK